MEIPPGSIFVTAPQPYAPLSLQPKGTNLPPPTAPTYAPPRSPLQLSPSIASPPPTLQTSGIVSPTGVTTGSPPTPISNVPTPSAMPGGAIRAPIPIGRIAGGAAIGGIVDFGGRLASGQSAGHAAMGATATTAGSVVLGAVGFAVGGPVGAMLGGMIGGAIAGATFDLLNPPVSAEPKSPFLTSPYGEANNFPEAVTLEYRSINAPSTVRTVQTWAYATGKTFDGYDSLTWNLAPGAPLQTSKVAIVSGSLNFPNGLPSSKPDQLGDDARSLPRSGPASPAVFSPPAALNISPSPGASVRPGGPKTIPSGKPADASSTNLGSNLPELQRQPLPATAPALDFAPAPDKPRLDLVPNLLQNPVSQPNNRGTTTAPPGRLAGPSPDILTQSAAPTTEPKTVKQTSPTPDSQKPLVPAAPTPETATQDLVNRLTSMESQLTAMGLALATLLAKPLASSLSPEEAKQAAASGTCQTLEPQNCLRKEFDEVGNQNQKNSNTLDRIDAAMQGLDLAAVAELNKKADEINTKLGPQIPNGGISGKLGKIFDKFTDVLDAIKDTANKTWNALGLDRVVSVLTLAASIHNAAMLSRELGETLVDTAETVIKALQAMIPGFLKKPDGENLEIDLSELLSNKVEKFLRDTLGDDNYLSLKASWIKANRILTASGNALSAIRGMNNAVTDGLEQVGACVSRGFNGIQTQGLVSDKTWPWMDETPNFKSTQITRFTNRIENAEDATSSVQQIAQAPIEFVEESKELVEATTEAKKAWDEDTLKKLQEEDKKDAESQSPDINDDDLLPSGGAE